MSNVTHPKHYNKGKIEVNDQQLNFERGNAVKYICRAGVKDPGKECEDLQKAIWYLQWEVEKLTAAAEGRAPRRPNDLNPRSTSATGALTSGQLAATTGFAQIAPPRAEFGHVMSLDGQVCVRCERTRAEFLEEGGGRCQAF